MDVHLISDLYMDGGLIWIYRKGCYLMKFDRMDSYLISDNYFYFHLRQRSDLRWFFGSLSENKMDIQSEK